MKLNLAEATALLASQVLEFIRDGRSVAELMDVGRQLLGLRQVMAGVAHELDEVQVEGTFPDGTKLVTVHSPISCLDGDLALALYGSFLPVPDLAVFAPEAKGDAEVAAAGGAALVLGQVITQPGELEINAGRASVSLAVTNLSDRPIQVKLARSLQCNLQPWLEPPISIMKWPPCSFDYPGCTAGGLSLPLHRDEPAAQVRPFSVVRQTAKHPRGHGGALRARCQERQRRQRGVDG
jgi:urease gamma subunit